MEFWRCVVYLCLVGGISFLAGRMMPKKWIDPVGFPFRSFAFERRGKLYEILGIRYWQNRVPDMSRIFRKLMPPKNLSGDIKQRLPELLRETCVAEWIHGMNCVAGLYCLRLWPGTGGVVMTVLFVLVFNLPYILIQRFNRPRLLQLALRLYKEEITRAEKAALQLR